MSTADELDDGLIGGAARVRRAGEERVYVAAEHDDVLDPGKVAEQRVSFVGRAVPIFGAEQQAALHLRRRDGDRRQIDRATHVWAPSATLTGPEPYHGGDRSPGAVEYQFQPDGTWMHRFVSAAAPLS